jgi:hypothetical protein
MSSLEKWAEWHVDLLLGNWLQQWWLPCLHLVTMCKNLWWVCFPNADCRLTTLNFCRFSTLVSTTHRPAFLATCYNSGCSSILRLTLSLAGDCLTILSIAVHVMYHVAWLYIPGDSNLYGHCCENLKFQLVLEFVQISFPIALFQTASVV